MIALGRWVGVQRRSMSHTLTRMEKTCTMDYCCRRAVAIAQWMLSPAYWYVFRSYIAEVAAAHTLIPITSKVVAIGSSKIKGGS
jgi:hypothetical protein